MPREPSEKMKQAEQLYLDGMKQVDIAKKLDIPDGTIRRWKHDHDWDGNNKKKQSERSEKMQPDKANVRKRKRGGQPQNKNSVGHAPSVPKRNKNAKKHGAFCGFYMDVLDEDEKSLMENVPLGEEEHLKQQIAVYMIREKRLLRDIQEFKDSSKKGLYVKGIKKKKHAIFDDDGKLVNEYEDTMTDTEASMLTLIKMESELTKMQRARTKCIDSLTRLRAINERYDDLLNGWKAKAAAESMQDNDDEIEDIQIYIPHNGRDENDKDFKTPGGSAGDVS